MKRVLILSVVVLFTVMRINAQSKVFKAVANEISSSMHAITQDNALVGYLMFTQLEKASDDSFSYKLTLMDENLNDIGSVEFKELGLALNGLSFEEDMLCLAYAKSSIGKKMYKNYKRYKEAEEGANHFIMLQFLNLEGKIIKTINHKAALTTSHSYSGNEIMANAAPKKLILKNIPKAGFALYYGDKNIEPLIVYNRVGEEKWRKETKESYYTMMVNENAIFMLANKSNSILDTDSTLVSSYNVIDGDINFSMFYLKDNNEKICKIEGYGIDAVTGQLYVNGSLYRKKKRSRRYDPKGVGKGIYVGVFNFDFAGKTEKDIKYTASYWDDGSKLPDISPKGRIEESKNYPNIKEGFRDFNGNTYLLGSTLKKSPQWGTIAVSVVLAPFIFISPIILGSFGTHKLTAKNVALLKMDAKGKLTVEKEFEANRGKKMSNRAFFEYIDKRKFYVVRNVENKFTYVIVDDVEDIFIYSLEKKKVVRTISHKDGKSQVNIYPAKEGHIMFVENNKREKYTRMSIEAL
jgi:hypothetical protein